MDEEQDTTTPAADTSSGVTEVAKNEALSDMMNRFQATLVREPISAKIKEFHAAVAEVAQKTAVLLLATKRINISGDPTIVGELTIVDAANNLRQVSDAILRYLNFIEEKTGLPSGGDTNLELEVKAGVGWANHLLASFKLLKKLERTAGGSIGIKPYKISTENGTLKILNDNGDWFEPDLMHPILRSPGTPWHKLLSGPNSTVEDRVLSSYQPKNEIDAIIPETVRFIKRWFHLEFAKHTAWFDAAGRVMRPDGDVEADTSATYALAVECGLAPTINFESESDPMFPGSECLSVRPGFTSSGRFPFEEMNFAISRGLNDDEDQLTLRRVIPCDAVNVSPGEEYPL